ncbi:hypothetical protein BGX38DRAFT_782835 [Terfezia claveryi]|nr:hypothetical protein BGX38DRAFT_782835 [Terfezia claveryi]
MQCTSSTKQTLLIWSLRLYSEPHHQQPLRDYTILYAMTDPAHDAGFQTDLDLNFLNWDKFQFTYDEKSRMYTLGEQLSEQLDGLEVVALEEPNTSEYPDISDLLPDFPLGIIRPPPTSPTTWPPTVCQTSLQFREYEVGSWSIHTTEPVGNGIFSVDPKADPPLPPIGRSHGRIELLDDEQPPGPFIIQVVQFRTSGEMFARWVDKEGTEVARYHGTGIALNLAIDIEAGFFFAPDSWPIASPAGSELGEPEAEEPKSSIIKSPVLVFGAFNLWIRLWRGFGWTCC